MDPSNPKDELQPLPDFAALSDDDLKSLIDELERAENAVSLRRRLLQGRIDILRAERTARLKSAGGGEIDLGRLTDILAARGTPDSHGRHEGGAADPDSPDLSPSSEGR